MAIVKELKDFMTRGNVVDMAVGIIMGGAFGKIVSSLVSDIVMPPIGVLLSGVNFTDLRFVLHQATADSPAVTLNYGNFLQTLLDFIIVATAIFFIIKGINTLRNKEDKISTSTTVEPTSEEKLLSEIRDLLKDKK